MDQPGSIAARTIRCPVCGDELAGKPWTCERCRTPHHEECVRYFGGCAIFGCRDGRPPTRLEVRPERVRGQMPRTGDRWSRFDWLSRGGLAIGALALLGSWFAPSVVTWTLAYIGFMAMVGARQLRRHTDEVELSLRRFEATYAPRLEKGKSGESAEKG